MIAVLLLATGCLIQQTEPTIEQQAQEIGRSLMCPVCPSETIDQSQVELAKQMRVIVLEKLAAGESRQQILDFFVSRYGVDVLAAPPKSGFNLLAWTVPGLAIVVAPGVLLLVLKSMRQRQGRAEVLPVDSPVDGDLAPYLARVDQEMQQILRSHSAQGSSHAPPERSAE